MNEEDYKTIISSYQQKSFEMFNQIIVLEAQINSLKNTINILNSKIKDLEKSENSDQFENSSIEEY